MTQPNKKFLIFVLVLLVIIAGYFMITRPSPSTTTEVPTNTDGQGKINIDAVCEGTLAYTTFENQAAADKFVAECKEGKHPEVIERYKSQMNLGDGAAI